MMIEITQILDAAKHVEDMQAVVFDLDDTLYSEKEYVRSGYREVGKVLAKVKNAPERLWTLFEQGKAAIDELLGQEGIYSMELKQACLHAYRNQVPDIHLYEGVRDMLERLKKKHVLGLITDGRPEGQRAKIQALELEGIFDYMIVTDELGGTDFRKPNPASFELMSERLGTAYGKMCYIGDNIRKDFIAPESLGMRCIWFQNADGIYA